MLLSQIAAAAQDTPALTGMEFASGIPGTLGGAQS
jgi:UDP-N-acetylenolpyruvoylglucosamine reductase